jgi:WD40 repeat protein/class 3 adenylate cyclase
LRNIPTGTVTFLFTDIEGSTTRWERYPTEMKAALAQHDNVMRAAFAAYHGTVFQTAGDSFVTIFARPAEALAAILDAQRTLRAAAWQQPIGVLRVRAALHTGPGEQRDDGYHAEFTLNRLARLLSAGHGGQILCTDTTRWLLEGTTPPGVAWQDLGECWLKDLIRPLHVYQVLAPDLPHDFAPLKTLDAPSVVAPAGVAPEEPAEQENPYKGLRAFQEADAPDFYGREALTEQIVARLGEAVALARFLAVVGPSGSGKSSVVRAGVLPALRRGSLPGSESWLLVEMIPGAQPLHALATALAAATEQAPATLLSALQADEYGLLHSAQHLLAPPADPEAESLNLPWSEAKGPKSALLLVIDQFEEVFTLVADEPARVHFLESLHRAVTTPHSPVRIIVTLRADFYDRPLLYPHLGELVRRRTEVVLPLTPDELSRAVSSPAARAGVTVEGPLVAAMLHDVAEQPGALPLLEYALTELFERRVGPRLTVVAYRASGGVQGALARRADTLYGDLTPAEQEMARQVFLRLVTLGEGAEDTRRRVRRTELAALPGDTDTLDGVLETFSRYRLLTFDRDASTGEPTVEVGHEALIRNWGRLRAWLDASRADLYIQRQLGDAAAAWARAGQDASFLASGGRLAQFEVLATTGDVALTGEEQTYLAASQAEAARRAATEQARQAQVQANLTRSEALRLAAEAVSLINFGNAPETAALLSLRSLRTLYTPEGDAALGRATMLRFPRLQLAATAGTGGVWGTAFSSDGKYLLTGSEDGAVMLWDVATGQKVRQFAGHDAKVQSVALSPDSTWALSASRDKTIALWDVTSGRKLREFLGHTERVYQVAFSPDGKWVLSGSRDRTARLWDAQTGQEVRQFLGHSDGIFGVAYSRDGTRIATTGGSGDRTARIWDAQTGQTLRILTGHTAYVYSVAFSPDGKQVLTASEDRTVRLWDAETGESLRTLTGHTEYVSDVAFSPDGKQGLTGSFDGTTRLWDLETGDELSRFAGANSSHATAFSPDGRFIVTGSGEGIARVWDTTIQLVAPQFVHPSSAFNAIFSPDGKWVLTSAGNEGTVRLWDAKTGAMLREFTRHTDRILGLAFSPDGQLVATGSNDFTARLWDVQTGRELRRITNDEAITSVAFSPDGNSLLVSDYKRSNNIGLFDVQTGANPRRFTGHSNQVYDVAFSPDGTLIVSASIDQTMRLWDARTGEHIRTLASDLGGFTSAMFSPDGTLIVSAGDGTIRLWDVQTGQEVQRITDHADQVHRATFSPDGRWLLGAGSDNLARLWDAQTGQEVRRFAGHTAALHTAAFSPDGTYILTSSDDHTARLWPIDHHANVTFLCGELSRDFTTQERAQFGIQDNAPTCPQK